MSETSGAAEMTVEACFNVWAEAPDRASDADITEAFRRVLAGDHGPRCGGWDDWFKPAPKPTTETSDERTA